MVEMLPLIKIVPEYNLTLDPSTGAIGAALGRDVVIVSLDDINTEIDTLEVAADELINSLDPTSVPADAYPGREGTFETAGLLTNVAYGFVIGLIILVAAIPILASVGVL
ncbi:tetrahydromethanopterin S-methyltransferase subunit B [Methanobrevibacter filiformis]|uniref:Tetrahydromethanopterin S-methyltransferase subunit B n=1 Tax=Methanobrevibacter filiformis TaxID=55758 RepID=A0A166A6W8_9EURY|nr:tetrahydromethanopterin S-methyltransferase subunit B [Methanobrevibacter filiformis]KZX11648.1 tetrahydromethanopterin S-methyltransferase subunit B [Methanobrevibacter filiformis]